MRKSPIKWNIEKAKEFTKQNSDCELLSTTFTRKDEKMLFSCKCGRSFETRLSAFIDQNKRQCDVCSGMRFDHRYVAEFVRDNSDCELLSGTYKGSDTKMIFQCQCGNKFEATFSKFKNRNKRQCNECGVKNTIIKQSKTHEEFVKEVHALVKDEYAVLSSYKNNRVKVKMRHNKCNHIWMVTPTSFLSGARCPNCMNRKNPDVFIKEVYELVGDEYVFLERYKNSRTKIKCRHNICGYEWMIQPNGFLNGIRCPKCNQRIPWTTEVFKNEIFNAVGSEYILLGESINSYTKVDILHQKCGNIWNTTPATFNKGSRCPHCVVYKGEDAIENFLNKANTRFIKQHSFDDCRNTLPLSFDFAVIDDNENILSLIEYDGRQHFEPVNFGGISDEEAHEKLVVQQFNDKIKNDYCRNNNIKLIRIPYWDFSNLEDILSRELAGLTDGVSE